MSLRFERYKTDCSSVAINALACNTWLRVKVCFLGLLNGIFVERK